MRLRGLVSLLLLLTVASTAKASNVVGNAERVWPTREIPVIVCDSETVERVGRDVCSPHFNWIGCPPGPTLRPRSAFVVREGLERWNRIFSDNLRFVEVDTVPEGPVVVFRSGPRASFCGTRDIGFSGRNEAHFVSIGDRCNPAAAPDGTNSGIVLHELMHVAGVFHEQQRFDREALFKVATEAGPLRQRAYQWRSICTPALERCSRGERVAMALGPYDFASIMHYPLPLSHSDARAELTRTGRTVLRLQALDAHEVGQRQEFSESDIRAVEYLYPAARAPARMRIADAPVSGRRPRSGG